MEDKKIELTLNLVNGILQYLGTRPYQEVFQLIQETQAQATPQLPVPDFNQDKEPA
jgi:hypothetical protein